MSKISSIFLKIFFHLQVTRKTAVGVPLATLASWPCWVAASTPASNFWALPEFFVKIWAGKFEKNIQTASTPASSFWELPEFLTTFHWNHNYGSFKNYIGKIFTLLHHLPSHLTLTFLTLNVHWHFISTYLPLLVNVVLEWPLICIWSCSFTQYYQYRTITGWNFYINLLSKYRWFIVALLQKWTPCHSMLRLDATRKKVW